MEYQQPRKTPEATGSKRLVRYMEARGWLCDKLGGSTFAIGWPDFWCFHPIYGERWIEAKAPGGKLRKTQRDRFTRWSKKGIKVYVLENETHYRRLFGERDNWKDYIRR